MNRTLVCYEVQGVSKTYIRYKSTLRSEAMNDVDKYSSTISSLVIDNLREQARGQNIAVLSLCCDY